MSALSTSKWHGRFSYANCETLKKTANQAVNGMFFVWFIRNREVYYVFRIYV